jgi:dolichyl-phosphate beta-glucosyltransferase
VGERPWLVVPCYNEEKRLDRAAFEAALRRADGPVLLFVDDGSGDGTRRLLESIRAAAPDRCHVLALPANRGKAEAVRAGLNEALRAGAARVGYWDADLATPLEAVADFQRELDERPEAEMVMGARVRMLGRRIDRHGSRHLIGRAYATLASLVLGLPVYDTQCGAKLFRGTAVLSAALDRPFGSRWAFDVELIQRLQAGWGHAGAGSIVEVPLVEWRDVGESKVSLVAGTGAFLFVLRLGLRRPPRHRPQPGPAREDAEAGLVAGGGGE